MATINAKKHTEAFVLDTERNFIRTIKEIPPILPQYFIYLERQTNVRDECPYIDRFVEVRIDKSKW